MKLSHTLIFLVILPIVIFAATYEITLYYIITDQIVDLTLSEATSLVELVSKELRNPMYFFDVSETNNIIKNLQLHPEIESVYVLFPDGRVFADGTKENLMFNKFLKDEFIQNSIVSNELMFTTEGDFLRIAAPIVIDKKIGVVQIDYSLYELDELISQSTFVMTIIATTIAIASGIIGYFVSLYVSRPILQLQNFSKKISENNFEPMSISGPKEIHDLADDLSKMAKKLEDSRIQLINSERLSSMGELSSRIAHDLRNPLNVLSNALEMIDLQPKENLDEKTRKYLPLMKDSIQRMTHQIREVLSFVQNRELKIKQISTLKILRKTMETIPIPENIKVILPKNDIEIFGDPEQILVVFSNLIINAVQAIDKDDGRILIRTFESEKDFVIEFEDSGSGVKPENISRIFEPLFTTKQTGTGLGLVSCKTIIEQHGGIISVKTPPTVFTITLPKTSS